MDRKRQNILTRIKVLKENTEDIKSEQPTGSDSTEIKLHQTEYTYDFDFNLAPSLIYYAYSFFNFPDTDPDPINRSFYSTMTYQIYYSNVGDPPVAWNGNSDLYVYPGRNFDGNLLGSQIQITNNSGVTKHIRIKMFALSTRREGTWL